MKINIINNGTCSQYSDIDFIASNETGIKEGEKIKVRAVSELYRFGVSTKEFKVEGLSRYLTNLDSLSDDLIEKISTAIYSLSVTQTGALITIERTDDLTTFMRKTCE